MNKILENHQKKEIRFSKKDLTMYELTDEQQEEIKNIINDNGFKSESDISDDNKIKIIRFIITETTSIGHEVDELSDEEMINKLDNGDRSLQLLKREIIKLIEEVVEDVYYEFMEKMRQTNSLLNILNNNNEVKMISNKMNKFFKKNKINMTFDELIKNPQNFQELINNKINK